MEDVQLTPVDEVALARLVLPVKVSTAVIGDAIRPLVGGTKEDAKKAAADVLARLKARGLIERDTKLLLTQEGRRRALAVLGMSELPKRTKADWKWAKKILVLRALGLEVSPVTIQGAGGARWLARKVVVSHHRLSLREETAEAIFAALARKALGLDGNASLALDDLFGTVLPRRAPKGDDPVAPPRPAESASPASAADDGLPAFAGRVRAAAAASATGRWHGNKVFISHVWDELRRHGGAGAMSFADFQRRLIEANRAQLVELSRADLVQAMPPADVAASETTHVNASFHFVRLDDR